MRWVGRRQSENVEDGRGSRAVKVGVGGGLGVLAIALLYALMGGDPADILQQAPEGQSPGAVVDDRSAGGEQKPYRGSPEEEGLRAFVATVLADTEDTWHEIFAQAGKTYEEPTLHLFTDSIESACGYAQAAVGPFYCPADRKVYIDLSFYQDLQDRFGAPGDFAQAYVIAHEIGHHVQNLLGISEEVHKRQSQVGEQDAKAISVQLELQADCFAGIWAHNARREKDLIESGDIEEGLAAASAIGDDRIQMASRGYVSPESFTHGSSKQRVKWFRAGVESGDVEACDTFNANDL